MGTDVDFGPVSFSAASVLLTTVMVGYGLIGIFTPLSQTDRVFQSMGLMSLFFVS